MSTAALQPLGSFSRAGHGSTVVLVHGYLGGAAMWRNQIERFSDMFDVIAPDLAGFGEAHAEASPDRIEAHAEFVLDLLSRLGIERFDLVGHSMGGMIVQEMARMAPERISRLVLYGTGPRGVMPDRFEPIETSRQRMRRDGVAATARRIAATWFRDGANAPAYPLCAELGARVSVETAIAGLDAMEAWDGRAGLAEITMPTLVLWGDGDRSYAWPQPEALWRGIAGSRLAVVPGCAHNVHQEKPSLFNALIADFLGVVGRSV
ncbi:alpha/beta fold hydrolase [Jiella marina]|uniref:alpha/beta fold hydrolase n=1 Tax=Jiella sp. LLJ827 TaxID=2917712 RepID=UPI002100DC5E|nr:alpha/beta hydrolase [Jiella sp. LLJ827]MCQ0988746.1 alpha/beta hydrolase [Jiella sp. LLJ827]